MCGASTSKLVPVMNPVNFTEPSQITDEELHRAINSIRRLDQFDTSLEPNFEWPTVNDLLAMPRDQPISVDAVCYQLQLMQEEP
jgi:hypothetical protein